MELLLQNAIDELGLLLLTQLNAVLAVLATTTLLRVALGLLGITHDDGVDTQGPAPLQYRGPIHCHIGIPSLLTRDDACADGNRCAEWGSCPECS